MALDTTQSKFFISASGSQVLTAFTTTGLLLGSVPGVLAFGGVATCFL